MTDKVSDSNMPWLLKGDLNEILKGTEKLGGRTLWKKWLFLQEFMDTVGAMDLGFSGKSFTWCNRHNGNTFIKESLDCMVACLQWLLFFQRATIRHLLMEESDHSLLLQVTDLESNTVGRPFRSLKYGQKTFRLRLWSIKLGKLTSHLGGKVPI